MANIEHTDEKKDNAQDPVSRKLECPDETPKKPEDEKQKKPKLEDPIRREIPKVYGPARPH